MRSSWSPAAVALVVLMALGSVVMWIGVPLALVYAASKLADSPNPSMGPYLLIIIGLPVGMAVVGKGLGWLNRAHIRLTGTEVDEYRPGWTRSMRGERHGRSARRGARPRDDRVGGRRRAPVRRVVLRVRRFVDAWRLSGRTSTAAG